MKAAIIGASAGVGRALSELLARNRYELLLVASDPADLAAQAAQLRLISEVKVQTAAADARDAQAFSAAIRASISAFGVPDSVFLTIGASRQDDNCRLPPLESQQLLNQNLLAAITVVQIVLSGMLTRSSGTLVGFGSVAALRGRTANAVYSAAKRGLESYFESLNHTTAQTGLTAQFYRLGYVSTQQSFGKRLLFPPARASVVARHVFHNLQGRSGLFHYPRYWSVAALVIRLLPEPIWDRLQL